MCEIGGGGGPLMLAGEVHMAAEGAGFGVTHVKAVMCRERDPIH